MRPLRLRARLAVTLVAVAVLAVALATLLGNVGLEPRLRQAAQARLNESARHTAEVAGVVYRDAGGWNGAARQTLLHVAGLDGLRVAVELPDGQRLPITAVPHGATATAPVTADGVRVGTVVVSATDGQLLSVQERHLRHSLDVLHLAAGGIAVTAGLLVAFVLAEALSRPLRRIGAVAQRLETGDLGARVELGGAEETRALGRTLNRLAETLQQEEELRQTSVADLAHELRTPVNGLLTRIEAAQDGVLPGPGNLSAMHEQARWLTRLLDDLARLADAQRPGLLLDKQPVDLAVVARQAVESFAPQYVAAGIQLTVDTAPAWVSGDPARLAQIAANLLSNAQRYTEPGGTVTVRVARSGDEAVLEVADTGIGIAPENLRHVFTRFWRGDRSRARATGGAGIGLTIVRELVRAHDGRVDVDSLLGCGSSFRVALPAVGSPTRAAA